MSVYVDDYQQQARVGRLSARWSHMACGPDPRGSPVRAGNGYGGDGMTGPAALDAATAALARVGLRSGTRASSYETAYQQREAAA